MVREDLKGGGHSALVRKLLGFAVVLRDCILHLLPLDRFLLQLLSGL